MAFGLIIIKLESEKQNVVSKVSKISKFNGINNKAKTTIDYDPIIVCFFLSALNNHHLLRTKQEA